VLAHSWCPHLQRFQPNSCCKCGRKCFSSAKRPEPAASSTRRCDHSAPESPKFIPAPPLLTAADVAAQQLRVQFAEQLDVVGYNARLRAFRESSEEIHRREQPLRRERVACRHHIQLPMQLLDEQQRVIIPTCGCVRRQQPGCQMRTGEHARHVPDKRTLKWWREPMMTTTAYSTAPLSAGVKGAEAEERRRIRNAAAKQMTYIEFVSSEAAADSTSLLSIFPTTQT
jgi:hypothetical protein